MKPGADEGTEATNHPNDAASGSGNQVSLPVRAQRRRVRRRVGRPPWVRLWNYFRAGPPAELAQSLVEICKPEETFSNSRGPWHRGLVVERERRSRKRSSPVVRYVRHGAPGEAAGLIAGRFRRRPITYTLAAAAVFWWFWPWIRPPVDLQGSQAANLPDVVSADMTDHRRTRTALNIWKFRPRALLVFTVTDRDTQSLDLIRKANLTDAQRKRLIMIQTCGDTVTEMADLSKWLEHFPRPGQLMLVSSPAHIGRKAAIGQVMLGGAGWKVEGVESLTSEIKPESIFRRWRDELRAQIWRATGISGKTLFVCRARDRGLI